MQQFESGLIELQEEDEWAAKEVHLTDDKHKVPELPKYPNCSSHVALYLQGNYELTAIPPLFFLRIQVLDLSHTSIKSLPKSLPKLVALKKLLLQGCDLFMELSPQVGELKNLEELDLDETQIMDLPGEIGKLLKLRQLKVSFYHFSGKKKLKSNILIHSETISNLSQLAELSIDVNPADQRWDDCVEAVVKEVCNSKTLRTLSLYLPKFQLLDSTSLIYPSLSSFRFTVGHHKRRIISRVPSEVDAEFRNWGKCLKFVNGENIPVQIKHVLKHSTSFFLDGHATAMNLSEFEIENMKGLKFCLLAECNKMETLIDGEMNYGRNEDDQYESEPDSVEHVLESLEYLSIYYMENLQSIWRGPNQFGCMSKLKFLALHTCPQLSKIFSHDLLENFVNLEEIILEDCPQVTSLVSHSSVMPIVSDKIFLPSLKRLLLLYLPELVSISNGLLIAPRLEIIGCYNCPKLTSMSKMELSSKSLKMIKGECKWWEDMNWNVAGWENRPDYLMLIFSPMDTEKDVMTQLVEDKDLLGATIQNEGQQQECGNQLDYLKRMFSPVNNDKDVMTKSAEDRGLAETSIENEDQQPGAEAQTSAPEITMSELTESTPLSHTGSPWSGDSDRSFKELDQFNPYASKKRKTLPTFAQHVRVRAETVLDVRSEDNYCWRIYGKKSILGAKYPRSYYRCTHRHSEGCLATKQVQRTDDDPRIFEINYHRTHTCKQEEGTNIEPQKMLHIHRVRDVRELYKLHSQPCNDHRANEVEDAAEEAKTISSTKGYGDVFEASVQDKEANPGIPEASIQDESKQTGAEPQTSAQEITRSELTEETPLSPTGCPWSGDPDSVFKELDQFNLDASSKRDRTQNESKGVIHDRYAFRVKSEIELIDDGYKWRKYGKKIKGTPNPRNYYKCSAHGCSVKKRIERDSNDARYVITTYEGIHNHEPYDMESYNRKDAAEIVKTTRPREGGKTVSYLDHHIISFDAN
ncbi:hypothetical protein V6N12_043801 [Hibiscus sabdariffa]|uniref:WRKY domain-containing protein n=1 Tax=Hibiscus sabdariffa TaxID=183260 RepID=A0ABR2DFE3_9ROSI